MNTRKLLSLVFTLAALSSRAAEPTYSTTTLLLNRGTLAPTNDSAGFFQSNSAAVATAGAAAGLATTNQVAAAILGAGAINSNDVAGVMASLSNAVTAYSLALVQASNTQYQAQFAASNAAVVSLVASSNLAVLQRASNLTWAAAAGGTNNAAGVLASALAAVQATNTAWAARLDATNTVLTAAWNGKLAGLSNSLSAQVAAISNAVATNMLTLVKWVAGSNNLVGIINTVMSTPTPTPLFVANTTTGAVPFSVMFTNQTSGSVTGLVWSCGDGFTTNVAPGNLGHTYYAAGTYTVTLVATGAGGSSTNSRAAYIVVTNPPAPVAEFTADVTNGPSPLTVNFTNLTSGGEATNFTLNFGDGYSGSTTNLADVIQHVYSAGTNNVTLVAMGWGGSSTNTKAGLIVVTNLAGAPAAGDAPIVSAWSGDAPCTLTVTVPALSSGATNLQMQFAIDNSNGNTGNGCSGTFSAWQDAGWSGNSTPGGSMEVGESYNSTAYKFRCVQKNANGEAYSSEVTSGCTGGENQ